MSEAVNELEGGCVDLVEEWGCPLFVGGASDGIGVIVDVGREEVSDGCLGAGTEEGVLGLGILEAVAEEVLVLHWNCWTALDKYLLVNEGCQWGSQGGRYCRRAWGRCFRVCEGTGGLHEGGLGLLEKERGMNRRRTQGFWF